MVFGATVFVVACLAAAALLSHLHRRALADAERELTNLALVLANYTENTFRSVDLLQDGLVQMVDALAIESVEKFNERLTSHAVDLDLHARIAALPEVEAVFFTNADGVTIASTRAWPLPFFSIADRPHFRVLRDDPNLTSYLAPPARNIQTGTWNIFLTRRISAPDGRFLGIVGVGLGLTHLQEFLSRITLGPDSAIAIWRRDGVLMVRYPPAAEATGLSPDAKPPQFLPLLTRQDSGTYRSPGTVDGRDRLIAVRALSTYPVAVTVSRTASEILGLWWQQAMHTAGALLLLAAILASVVLLGIRQLRSRDLLDRARTELRVLEEQRRSEAQIAFLAHHDPLTGLANRTLFRAKLDEAVARARRGEACAVLCLDLDHFKDVNDTLGHPVGDMLLQAVTERLRAEVRETDTIARLGGDEFAVVQTGVRQPHDAGTLAQRIVEVLGAPFDIDGHHVTVGASIGIAVAPSDGLDSNELLKDADMALYRAKAAGRGGFRFFEPEMNTHAQMRRTLQLDLRRALGAGEFELFYQPQVDIATRRVIGFEALLRWRHPERGLIMPDRFVMLAEEVGLIVPLGEWVLRHACAEAATWSGGQRIAVNLSAVQFGSSLVAAVASALEMSGLDPVRLELEITETVLLRDSEATLATLHRLKALGVAIALDDFGTGYSSLGYLQRFPFDRVKIDRSFINSLGHARESDAIVRSVIDLCAALDMSITAEGVETEEQYRILAASGCHEAQGYLFGKPGLAEGIPALLAA